MSKFKFELAIVRVGEYLPLGKVHSITKKSSAILCNTAGKLLSGYIDDPSKTIIICSERFNCPISAKIISEEIGVGYERFKAKWMDDDQKVDFEELYKIVQEFHKNYPRIILVTLYRETEDFPNFYLKKKYGFTIKTQPLENSEALIIGSDQRIHYISATTDKAVARKIPYLTGN